MSQILSVQVLRGVAALTVVFGHAQHDAKMQSLKLGVDFDRVHVLPWGAGVDLFFVISGFIMVFASERLFAQPGGAGRFLARRVARIAPLYWLFTALYLAVLLRGYLSEGRTLPATFDIASSFAFWPTDAFADGVPRPILTLGWTLNYEMFFYVVFALFIGFTRERAVLWIVIALSALVGIGTLVPASASAPFFWTRPILLEFTLGMGLALLYRRGVVLPVIARALLGAAGIAILLADPVASGSQALDWITPNDGLRVLAWGVPTAMIMAAAVLAPRSVPSRLGRAGAVLGDASYALYLSHPFVIFGFRKMWLAAGLHEVLGLWAMVGGSLVLSCAVALIVHRLVEQPLTERAQNLLSRRSRQAEATQGVG